MNTDRTLRPKLGLLRLAEKLGNVTRACQSLGYSRDSYYRFKALYERGGADALRNFSRRGPMVKNRVTEDVAQRVLDLTYAHPTWGQQRVADTLSKAGVSVSSSGVRSIWMRAGLETFEKRVFALAARAEQNALSLSEEQQAAIDRARSQGRFASGRYIAGPGKVCFQDLSVIGQHPSYGSIYHHTFIDCYSQFAITRMATEGEALSPSRFLQEDVLPVFADNGIAVESVRTDRRPPFADRHGRVEYQLFLAGANIRQTYRLGRAGRQDICSRLVATMAREVYQPLFRQGNFTLEDARAKLKTWMRSYNEERGAEGPYCYGKTPVQTFSDAMARRLARLRLN